MPISRISPKSLRYASRLCLFLAAVALAVAAFATYRQHVIASSWPTVEAQVLHRQIGRQRNMRSGRFAYSATIAFRFQVMGTPYEAACSSTRAYSDITVLWGKVQSFNEGTHHQIRYNPADPHDIRFDAAYSIDFFIGPVAFCCLVPLLSALGGALSARARSSAHRVTSRPSSWVQEASRRKNSLFAR